MAKINNKAATYRNIQMWSFVLRLNWANIRAALALFNTGLFVGLLISNFYDWETAFAICAMPSLVLEVVLLTLLGIAQKQQIPSVAKSAEKRLDTLYVWCKPLD